jgi:DNA repair protein RadA/Sms
VAKTKIAYFCQSCGFESAKWLGKCPSCQQWNTFVEEIIDKGNTGNRYLPGKLLPIPSNVPISPCRWPILPLSEEHRMLTPDKEFNRVLGGGIVAGSLVLIGGEPGIGKSTLMLQLALNMPISESTLRIGRGK